MYGGGLNAELSRDFFTGSSAVLKARSAHAVMPFRTAASVTPPYTMSSGTTFGLTLFSL